MIRASNNDCECRDDSLQTRGDTHSLARNRREQHDMHHVRSPVSEKRSNAPKRCPPADNDSDIHIGRCAWTEGNRSPQGRAGERRPISSCFFTANGGLFERPKAAFFTVAAAGVMPCMTVVMGPMTRRKTCFPTGIGDSAAKAKPPAVTTAFCIHLIPLIGSADNR